MRLIRRPVLANYYLTYRCNASCSFCDIWERPSPYADLETVRQNLTALKKLGVKVVDFTGGEPLLHRQIGEILGLAKSLGLLTTVTTNCLLYPKKAEELAGKVDMLHFSLDSADRETHDKLRNSACFDFVIQSLDRAAELGERPDILFTVFEHNLHEISRIYEEISRPRNLVLILNPVFDYGEKVREKPLSAKSLAFLRKFGRKAGVFLNEAFLQLRENGGNKTEDPVCRAAGSSVVISPENRLILPCYHLGINELPIENNLEDLWLNSEEAQEARRTEGRLPACEGCTINCYMQPSFSVEISRYWWAALPSALKYNWMKGTWKKLFVR